MTTLSQRQQQIVELLCADKCRKGISSALGLARQTVDTHIVTTKTKTGAVNDSGIVAWAFQNGVAKIRKPCCPECR